MSQHSLTIRSGGQTGVDRAALDVAMTRLHAPCTGWCPHGRLAEDGVIDRCYPLKETLSPDYEQRTRWNVRDSDGTLILVPSLPTVGGTELTILMAKDLYKPYLVIEMSKVETYVESVKEWIELNKISDLNIAGPRESTCPGVYNQAKQYLEVALKPFST